MLVVAPLGSPAGSQAADGKVKVFTLAGQSNMEGKDRNALLDTQAERLMTEKDPAARERNKEELKECAGDDGYHYHGSPIWYTRIGKKIAETMLELLKNQSK